jgi:hypothetical protein
MSRSALPVFFAAIGYAQTITTGELTGTVTTSNRLSVGQNAQITLKSSDTGNTRTISTNNDGAYRFTTLKPGAYQLSVFTSNGKLRSDVVTVLVSLGQVVTVNPVVKPERSRFFVTVTSGNSETSNISTSFTAHQLNELPAPGQDLRRVVCDHLMRLQFGLVFEQAIEQIR